MAFTNSGGCVGAPTTTGVVPLTLFIRAKTSDNTSIQGAINYCNITLNERRTVFFRGDITSPNKSTDAYAQFAGFSHTRSDGLASDYTINEWHVVALRHAQSGVSTNNVSRDDTAHTVVTSSDGIGTVQGNRINLGADVVNTTLQSTLAGPYCSGAMWSAELGADEMVSLFRGFSPRRIRPQNLLWYAPCIREMIEIARGNAMTDTGTHTVEDHPRSYGT